MVKRDKEGHYTMIKGSIHQEDTTINIYAPNAGAHKYIKQKLTEVKRNSNTVTAGEAMYLTFSNGHRPSRETGSLHTTSDQQTSQTYRTP